MGARSTVIPDAAEGSTDLSGGLRERKKRLLRQQLSDAATRLFLERGFDGVRIAEIADECRVSESTVFNYYPTKEALILDRLDGTIAALRDALRAGDQPPVATVTAVLAEQLRTLLTSASNSTDEATAMKGIHRFGELIRSTPSLRAHYSDKKEQCITEIAAVLARRTDTRADDPKMTIAATALVGLWQVQADALYALTAKASSMKTLPRKVDDAVRSAAELIEAGLDTLT